MSPNSLYKKDTRKFSVKYFNFLLFLSAVVVIAIVFILAIAITPQSFYTVLGGV